MPKSNADYIERIMKQGLVEAADVRRFGVGDQDFDAKRNMDIVKRTIEKTNKRYSERRKLVHDGIKERSQVIASYINHMTNNNSDLPIEKYAGWKTMKALWGEARAEEIKRRAMLSGYNIN